MLDSCDDCSILTCNQFCYHANATMVLLLAINGTEDGSKREERGRDGDREGAREVGKEGERERSAERGGGREGKRGYNAAPTAAPCNMPWNAPPHAVSTPGATSPAGHQRSVRAAAWQGVSPVLLCAG